MAETRAIPVRLPDELIERLDRMITLLGVGSRNDHMRKAIEEYVIRFEQSNTIQPTPVYA